MNLRVLIYLLGGLLFAVGFAAHVYVRWRMRVGEDLDEVASEFQEQHSEYARYLSRYRITLAVASAGALLLFAALAI